MSMPRSGHAIVERALTRALVLRRTVIGDADLLMTLFTETHGVLTAAARGARRPSSRLGALEPIHTLQVTLELKPGSDIGKLRESRIDTPRLRATHESGRMDAAFKALTWVRSVSSPLQPEPRVFATILRLLDTLEAEGPVREIAALAAAGLHILDALGYGLELDACVSCGKVCPPESSATVDPARGGIVCRACGGARMLVRPQLRRAMAGISSGGHVLDTDLSDQDARSALDVVESAIAAHALPPVRLRKPLNG